VVPDGPFITSKIDYKIRLFSSSSLILTTLNVLYEVIYSISSFIYITKFANLELAFLILIKMNLLEKYANIFTGVIFSSSRNILIFNQSKSKTSFFSDLITFECIKISLLHMLEWS